MAAVLPSLKTTLVILLGASRWPLSPEFQASQAFLNSATELRAYFLNPSQFGLSQENLLDLFNSNQSADDIDGEIGLFLEKRMAEMKQAGQTARDLLVYFVGHGGFVGNDSDFYLAIRRTRSDNPSASGIRMMSLAYTLKEKARYLRRIVILDCCFAGAAFSAFQSSGPAQVAIVKTVDAFGVQGKGAGLPERGTSLLCSSRHTAPSLISQDGTHTIFSQALLHALSTGNPRRQDSLSLREIADLTEDVLSTMPEKSVPRPEVHSPDQVDGDVADVPFFPNPATRAARASANTEAVYGDSVYAPPPTPFDPSPATIPALNSTLKAISPAQTTTPSPNSSPGSVLPFDGNEGETVSARSQGFFKGKILLLIILALLVIVAGVGFPLARVLKIGVVATTPTTSQVSTSAATVTAQAIGAAANSLQNPYPPGGGSLALKDDLHDNTKGYKWEEENDGFGSCLFAGEAYHFVMQLPGLEYCYERAASFVNFVYQVQLTIVKGKTGGIVFRSPHGDQNLYYFYVGSDGTYGVSLYTPQENAPTATLKSGFSPAVRAGPGQSNLVAVVARGSTFDLYVNLVHVAVVQDNKYSSGYVGAGAYSGLETTEVVFSNAKVWKL